MQDKRIIPNRTKELNKLTNLKQLSGRRHPASQKTSLNDPAKVKSFRDNGPKLKWTKQDLLELEE